MTTAIVACGALALHVSAIAERRGWNLDVHPLLLMGVAVAASRFPIIDDRQIYGILYQGRCFSYLNHADFDQLPAKRD